MATISAMARNTYMMYKFAQKNGQSLFGNNEASLKFPSASSFAGVSAASSANAVLSGLMGIRTNLAEMVKSYDSAAKTFRAEFNSTMDDLAKASADLKKTNFDVGGETAVTRTTNEDGTVSVTKSDTLKDVMKSIENFADKYNNAIYFFHDNADVSKHTKNMVGVFSDTTYRANQLAQIGVIVDSDGKMKLDEDVLTESLTKNPTRVEHILGAGGLATKADTHISFARSQQNRLFPSAAAAMGGSIKQSSVYTGQSLLSLSRYSNVGNLLNMFV